MSEILTDTSLPSPAERLQGHLHPDEQLLWSGEALPWTARHAGWVRTGQFLLGMLLAVIGVALTMNTLVDVMPRLSADDPGAWRELTVMVLVVPMFLYGLNMKIDACSPWPHRSQAQGMTDRRLLLLDEGDSLEAIPLEALYLPHHRENRRGDTRLTLYCPHNDPDSKTRWKQLILWGNSDLWAVSARLATRWQAASGEGG